MKVCKSSIFHSGAQLLVNPVNCQGCMGALAGAFLEYYPTASRQYQRYCEAGNLRPGGVMFVKEGETWIGHLATMVEPGEASRLEWVEAGLNELGQWLTASAGHYGISRVAIPALGCGVGGLQFEDVQRLVQEMSDRLPLSIDVYLYAPLP